MGEKTIYCPSIGKIPLGGARGINLSEVTHIVDRRNLIVIVGPTAVGKTAAAIELAQRLDGEIVNADSMQVYWGMDIGTAKPTWEERERVRFHLLDVTTPDIQLTVAEWKQSAEQSLVEIRARSSLPIVCGGTGLYIRALLDNWTLAGTPADIEVRAALQSWAASAGSPALHQELQSVDPITAARLHPNDMVRIVRALEVYRITGRPISQYQHHDRETQQRKPAIQIGLTMSRPDIYQRIDQRVDDMIALGFEQEVRELLARGYKPTLSALKSLGYKEMTQYLTGELDYSTAVETIKQNTRRFAKRQQTWFRADKSIHWLDVTALSSATVASQIQRGLETGSLDAQITG